MMDIIGKLLKLEKQVTKIICNDLDTEIKHTFLVSEENYDPDNPLEGWESPRNPVLKDTASVLFSDDNVVNYTYVINEETNKKEWQVSYVNSISSSLFQSEEKFCLNETNFTPADVNNPTTEEVQAWVENNLTQEQKDNGTILTYFVEDLGDCDNPDFIWALNDSNKITLDYKRIFNTKTVYVDAGSGSDVTGRRGYRNFPFKTLNAAFGVIESGDLLYVFPGTYTNTIISSIPFNIYCEDGVTWYLNTTRIFNDSITNANIKCRFDYLYSTAASDSLAIRGYILNDLDFKANKIERIAIGIGKGITNIDIGTVIDSRINLVTNAASANAFCTIKIGTLINTIVKTNNNISTYAELSNINVSFNNEINNFYSIVDNAPGGGVFHCGGASDIGVKNLIWKGENFRFYPTSIYSTPPSTIWVDPRVGWYAGTSGIGNQVMWIRDGFTNGCVLNAELKNYRGTGHGFMMYGWHFDTPSSSPTELRIINVKIQGHWEKGIPVSLHWFGALGSTNCPQNTIVNIDLDVVCDTSMGVAFWCTQGIHESNRFNITGKIVTKSAGMPCITLSNISGGEIQTNNTITLKDLLLINDGTVPPIMINPASTEVQNVNIINVKSNSLVVDTNITEVGELITRNSNYN